MLNSDAPAFMDISCEGTRASARVVCIQRSLPGEDNLCGRNAQCRTPSLPARCRARKTRAFLKPRADGLTTVLSSSVANDPNPARLAKARRASGWQQHTMEADMKREKSKAKVGAKTQRGSAFIARGPETTRPTVPGYEFSAKKTELLPWKWAVK